MTTAQAFKKEAADARRRTFAEDYRAASNWLEAVRLDHDTGSSWYWHDVERLAAAVANLRNHDRR